MHPSFHLFCRESHTSGHSRVTRDATLRTSDRERRNWARRFDWLELRCQDRVRVRRTASELESSPIVIESQLSSSRSKSPELTRRRRLWLSESDIALGLFLESRWRGRQRRRATVVEPPRKRDQSKDAQGLPLSAGSLERRNEIRHIFRSNHDFGRIGALVLELMNRSEKPRRWNCPARARVWPV